MPDSPELTLQHLPGPGSALSTSSTRIGLLARARRDAAASADNPHFTEAVRLYNAGSLAAAAAAFRSAAEAGHAESQYLLSTLLDAGEGVPPDPAEAARWERRAAEQNHAHAQANLSYRFYAAGNFVEAFAWCQRAAHSQLAWAQYHLGLMHRKGEGTPQSDADAAQWYTLAAHQGHAEAEQKLADLYTFGRGVAQSFTDAALWYRRAAEHGNAEAQFQLGHLYATGQGVDPDYTLSRHWIRQAALQNHPEALREQKRREYRDP